MQILDNIIILLLPVLAFIAGKRISDRYHADTISWLQYQLRVNAAERGVGYVATPLRKQHSPIGQPFMDRLRENGRATQAIRTPQNTTGSDGASA